MEGKMMKGKAAKATSQKKLFSSRKRAALLYSTIFNSHRVIPHEGGLEVIVVSVAMNRFQGGHFEQEARQGVQQVVVQQQRLHFRAKGQRVGN